MTANDPILGLTDEQRNKTVDPQVAATQLGNLLHILAGTGQATDMQTMTTPTIAQTPTAAPTGSVSPVEGGTPAVNQPFGGGHPGIDLATPVGAHLLAAINGTVTVAGNSDPGGYGNEVEITGPDGLVVRYGHLSAITVKQGDQVTAGQAIGQSGGVAGAEGSGNSTGPHLHFEVRQNGQAVDPSALLAGGAAIVGTGSATNPTPASPEEIVAAQLGNTLSVLSGQQPTDQTAQATTTTSSGQGGDFFGQVLAGIGAPDTPENRKVLSAWARAEGMDPGANNPFATTQGAPGAVSINEPGVKRYTDVATGAAATIQTLLNGRYGNIIDALKAGNNALAVAAAIKNSPWGTGALVEKIVREG